MNAEAESASGRTESVSKIAFLGAGNMAAAMVDGLLAQHVQSSALICYTASGKSAAALAARTGIACAASLDELLANATTLVVAFKPYHLASADSRLATLTANKLVISVLAGKDCAALSQKFPNARAIIRAAPNTPAAIGAGMTGWCSCASLSAADRAVVEKFFGALGRAVEIPEAQLNTITAFSGSGPAYIFEFAAALREAGTAAGLSPTTAEMFTRETLFGAASLLTRTSTPFEQLRDAVTSPNGVTFAGLQRLAARDFRGLVCEAVLAGKLRAEEISTAS